MPYFSIIIPVYNVENYLNKCINSILDQIDVNYEVILVDDGSTDNSAHICQKYAENHKNIFFFSQKNQGQGKARNEGVKKSNGDFLIFVDSDDYLANKECLKKVADSISDDTELVVYGLKRNVGIDKLHKKRIEKFLRLPQDVDTGEKYIVEMVKGSTYFPWGPCNIAYRKRYWDENRYGFPEKRAYEDMGIIWKVIARAKKISVLREIIYIYRIDRLHSTTKIHTEESACSHMELLRDNVASLEAEDFSQGLKDAIMSTFTTEYFNYILELAGSDFEVTSHFESLFTETYEIFKNRRKVFKHKFVSMMIKIFGIKRALELLGRIRTLLYSIRTRLER